MEISKHAEIIPLHFSLYPYYCENSMEMALDILKKLKEKTGFKKMVVFPWGKILSHIMKNTLTKYQCVLCRKTMLKVAERVCESQGAQAIVTGESLGQKASQTLENMSSSSYELKYPVIRPLVGRDKDEIKNLSFTEERHVGCCSATPEMPVTKAFPKRIDKIYREIGLDEKIKQEFDKSVISEAKSKKDIEKVFFTLLGEK